jgi:antitoxin (DNA-binding transcriptional repressor) of toxin-antitoxin stability system
MSSTVLTVTEAVRHFSDYIGRVAYRHETFVLRKGKKPVAELRPLPYGRRLGDLPGLFRSIPHLSPNDIAAFEADVNAARSEMPDSELRDPWAS